MYVCEEERVEDFRSEKLAAEEMFVPSDFPFRGRHALSCGFRSEVNLIDGKFDGPGSHLCCLSLVALTEMDGVG